MIYSNETTNYNWHVLPARFLESTLVALLKIAAGDVVRLIVMVIHTFLHLVFRSVRKIDLLRK